MFQGEIVRVSTGPARNHVIAALVATVVSVALHVAFLALLPRIRLGIPTVPKTHRVDSEFRALHLQHVEPRPDLSAAAPAAEADARGGLVNLADFVKELGLKPEQVVIEPPSITDEGIAGEKEPIVESEPLQERDPWEPRQEIVAVDMDVASDEILDVGRREVPAIERVSHAPDIVMPVDRKFVRMPGPELTVDVPGARLGLADIRVDREGLGRSLGQGDPGIVIAERAAESSGALLSEEPSDITSYEPIEDLLQARVSTYTTLRDFKYGYFRIEIERIGPRVLPVIPKDIVFVQDCSASMSEQRLYFCRRALIDCFSALDTEDRFNVVGFRDSAEFLSPGWLENTPDTRKMAITFVEGLRAAGNTDIYGSMKELMKLERTAGRPVIAMMLSDGIPTHGIVDSSDIISEFTRINDGRISVFSMGTAMTANTYLLDLLSYCNKGDASLVKGGRWGIPEDLKARVQSVSRPVLSGVRFQFTGGGTIEVYPGLTSDLYLDKALMLYGRYPRGTGDVAFQVVGQALEKKCDMIFSLALDDEARTDDKEIRTMWAKQKLYHLIGEYGRSPDENMLKEIRSTSRGYRVRVPHRGSF